MGKASVVLFSVCLLTACGKSQFGAQGIALQGDTTPGGDTSGSDNGGGTTTTVVTPTTGQGTTTTGGTSTTTTGGDGTTTGESTTGGSTSGSTTGTTVNPGVALALTSPVANSVVGQNQVTYSGTCAAGMPISISFSNSNMSIQNNTSGRVTCDSTNSNFSFVVNYGNEPGAKIVSLAQNDLAGNPHSVSVTVAYHVLQQVSAGWEHTCGNSTASGATTPTLYCWGMGTDGILGDGTISDTSTATPVAVRKGNLSGGGVYFSQVASGLAFTCGLGSDHKAYCWGDNTYDQIGANPSAGANTNVPMAVDMANVDTGGTFNEIATGAYHACGISPQQNVYCWGRNNAGQTGQTASATVYTSIPTQVANLSNVIQISAGFYHTCALKSDQSLWCWGDNTQGALGNNTLTNSSTPVQVLRGYLANATEEFTQVSAGYYFTCAATNEYFNVYCWGLNKIGNLGVGSTTPAQISQPMQPVTKPTGVNFVTVSASLYYDAKSTNSSHACATTDTGAAYCWGYNGNGELGNSTSTNATTPVAVSVGGLTDTPFFDSISAGDSASCAHSLDGSTYCWGAYSYDSLGVQESANQTTPVLVAYPN